MSCRSAAAAFESDYYLTSIPHQNGGAAESADFASVRFAPRSGHFREVSRRYAPTFDILNRRLALPKVIFVRSASDNRVLFTRPTGGGWSLRHFIG